MTSNSTITKPERDLLQLLSISLCRADKTARSGSVPALTEKEWEQVMALADRHEVLPLLENVPEFHEIPDKLRQTAQFKTAATVHKGIQLQVLSAGLTALLEREGITAVTLKGCAVARFYPVPEFRKTTDIDLFVADEQAAERAVQVLGKNGFQSAGGWHANHHLVLVSEKKEVLELHTAWAEIFRERHLNQYLKKLQKESIRHCGWVTYQGLNFYAYEAAWQGFYLLIHMLQHFLGSGFGLRNLCDWVVLWENCEDKKVRRDFWKMVCESHTERFAGAVTAVCVKYLGLDRAKSPVPAGVIEALTDQETADALLRDILDAGEFGYSEAERMVGMDGNSLSSYVREFHHQMHVNFPQAGKILLFWPVLWAVTLARFLNNNRKLKRAPVSAVMKKAGERGRLVKRLMSGKGKAKRSCRKR